MRSKRKLFLGMFVAAGLFFTLAGDVLAVIGRPLTPMSYAGVARRTVRRNAYYY
jgi:hypothetical protein